MPILINTIWTLIFLGFLLPWILAVFLPLMIGFFFALHHIYAGITHLRHIVSLHHRGHARPK